MSRIDPNTQQSQQIALTKKTMEAEKEAQRKIQESRKKIRDTEIEEQKQLEKIKDDYQKLTQKEVEKSGYNLMLEKSTQAARFNDLKREHSSALYKEHNQFKDTYTEKSRDNYEKLARLDQEGKDALLDTEQMYQNLVHTENLKGSQKLKSAQEETDHQLEAARITSAEKQNTLVKENEKQIENVKNSNTALLNNTHEQFIERFQNTKNAQEATLGRLNKSAIGQLNELKSNYSEKLSAYSSRQSDPFYSLKDLGATIEENENGFLLQATVPSHEQDFISVTVRDGDSIILSGKRRNNETHVTEDGFEKTTHSFQSYSQVIPMRDAIEQRLITKNFEGDQLKIFLPKKNIRFAPTPPYKAQAPIKPASFDAYQKPEFPDNLPKIDKKV